MKMKRICSARQCCMLDQEKRTNIKCGLRYKMATIMRSMRRASAARSRKV